MSVGRRTLWIIVVSGILAGCMLAVLVKHPRSKLASRQLQQALAPPVPTDPWREAANKVEEDRGEPVGAKATVQVPSELRHYLDHRRFLAVQLAEWHKHNYDLPADYADLAGLVIGNQLIELEVVADDYILYGAGESATDGPFTHFDRATGESIPVYPDDDEFSRIRDSVDTSIKGAGQSIAELERTIRSRGKVSRALRKQRNAQLKSMRLALAHLNRRLEVLDYFQRESVRRELLHAEYRELTELAADFKGKAYRLEDPEDRRALKMRLLRFVRPEAASVLLEIARAYKERFNRPLPVTSVIRTEEYQKQLAKTNPNAAHVFAPPHTTGLAFDIYNHYMSGSEQEFLMNLIAGLKSSGRIEALKEHRDHIHVFVFPDGEPPAEKLIAESIDQVRMKQASNRGARREYATAKRKRSTRSRKVA